MTNQGKGYRRARRIAAKRRYVNEHMKRRPDFRIGFSSGFYAALLGILPVAGWFLEFAIPYKYGGFVSQTELILWGVASFAGLVALIAIFYYCLPTIMWRAMWSHDKSRAEYPEWVDDVERLDRKRRQ